MEGIGRNATSQWLSASRSSWRPRAGHPRHDGLGLLLQRRQGEVRPLPGHRPAGAHRVPLGPEERVREEPAPRPLEAGVNQTFSPSFFVSAKAAYYNNGFGLFSRGDGSYTYDYDQGEMLGNYYSYFPVRPQKDVDGSHFVEASAATTS
jgi:hypothetical protein